MIWRAASIYTRSIIFNGASLGFVQVHNVSANVPWAEGLAQVDGQLKIGHRVAGATFTTRSNALGDLALDGLVTNIQTNASSFTQAGLDFDALGVNAIGQLYGADSPPFQRPSDTDFTSLPSRRW